MQPQTLVWVKVEAYPWWPAVVVDPSALAGTGYALPEGKDTLVQFLGTGDTGCVNGGDPNEVVLFSDSDSDKLACTEDPACAAAIEEALALYREALRAAVPEAVDAVQNDEQPAEGQPAAGGEERLTIEGDDDADRERRKREKRDKKRDKREKKDKKHKKEKHDKKRHRHHDSSEEDDSGEEDDGNRKRKQQKEQQRTVANESVNSGHRANPRKGNSAVVATTPAAAPLVPSGRRSLFGDDIRQVSDRELVEYVEKLEALMAQKDQARIRLLLSDLARIQVSPKQLSKTRIGAVVGQLLSGGYKFCELLANAILKFWFSLLPAPVKEKLANEDEIDLASNQSQDDASEAVEDMAQLHRIGVDIERCFDVEEEAYLLSCRRSTAQSPVPSMVPMEYPSPITGAPGGGADPPSSDTSAAPAEDPSVNVRQVTVSAATLARRMEELLQNQPEALVQHVLTYLKNSAHSDVRIAMLQGELTADAFIERMTARLEETKDWLNPRGEIDVEDQIAAERYGLRPR